MTTPSEIRDHATKVQALAQHLEDIQKMQALVEKATRFGLIVHDGETLLSAQNAETGEVFFPIQVDVEIVRNLLLRELSFKEQAVARSFDSLGGEL